MTRTDEHRPSVINPEEYEFVAVTYNSGGLEAVLHDAAQRQIIREHMIRTGGVYSMHEHGGSCHVCGAHANYLACFYHAPSNSYIEVGETCCGNLGGNHKAAFRNMRKSVTDWNNLKTGQTKAKQILQDAGLNTAWDIYEEHEKMAADFRAGIVLDHFHSEEMGIIANIIGKLVRYESLSDKQINFVRKMLNDLASGNTREERRKNLEAKWAAENAAAESCPEGRTQIEGVILKLKEPDEYAQFPSWKMMVKDNRGFRVWGSVPSSIEEANKGDKVRFTATITPSKDDDKFGFYKRPSKAEIIIKAEGE